MATPWKTGLGLVGAGPDTYSPVSLRARLTGFFMATPWKTGLGLVGENHTCFVMKSFAARFETSTLDPFAL